ERTARQRRRRAVRLSERLGLLTIRETFLDPSCEPGNCIDRRPQNQQRNQSGAKDRVDRKAQGYSLGNVEGACNRIAFYLRRTRWIHRSELEKVGLLIRDVAPAFSVCFGTHD